jgi:hypothetical protein
MDMYLKMDRLLRANDFATMARLLSLKHTKKKRRRNDASQIMYLLMHLELTITVEDSEKYQTK